MKRSRIALVAALLSAALWTSVRSQTADSTAAPAEIGRRGGDLVVAQRAEPRTFNPLIATDAPSKDVIWRTAADLVHINRATQQPEAALATSWSVSHDGRSFTVSLRRGVRFSDGHPFDADDVMFSFAAYLDPRVQAPQRDLLTIAGTPVRVRKIDQYTVAFDLAEPYAAAERLFDGIAMLPRHVLEPRLKDGTLRQAWNLATPPSAMVGLGPFRVTDYRQGERIVLDRNPYYWKSDAIGTRLPYLDRVIFEFIPSEESQILRFRAGELDALTRVPPPAAAVLSREASARGFIVRDLGASLEDNVLVFNLNDGVAGDVAARQRWFRDERVRRGVSLAIDRRALVHVAYRDRATPLGTHVTPGNRLWVNRAIGPPARDVDAARAWFKAVGFEWDGGGTMVDRGASVSFTLLAASGNTELMQMATLIEDDLRGIGLRLQIVPLEFRTLVDRVLTRRDFDAALMRLGSGDADPNGDINVLTSDGATHLWQLQRTAPLAAWQIEIDRLMRDQLTTTDRQRRKEMYDRVQAIMASELPMIPLVSPNVVVAARQELGNLRPGVIDHYLLWNVDELFWRSTPRRTSE